jgi:Na+/phosphate symporter
MADVFETMLAGTLDSLDRGDRKRVTETKRMDDVLDGLDREIKEYIASLDIDAFPMPSTGDSRKSRRSRPISSMLGTSWKRA